MSIDVFCLTCNWSTKVAILIEAKRLKVRYYNSACKNSKLLVFQSMLMKVCFGPDIYHKGGTLVGTVEFVRICSHQAELVNLCGLSRPSSF